MTAKGILSDSINNVANYARIDRLAQAFSVAQHHGLFPNTFFVLVPIITMPL